VAFPFVLYGAVALNSILSHVKIATPASFDLFFLIHLFPIRLLSATVVSQKLQVVPNLIYILCFYLCMPIAKFKVDTARDQQHSLTMK
jgi:uncharacterized membrane protein